MLKSKPPTETVSPVVNAGTPPVTVTFWNCVVGSVSTLIWLIPPSVKSGGRLFTVKVGVVGVAATLAVTCDSSSLMWSVETVSVIFGGVLPVV